ncbi:MAG: hypothetical protein U9R66_09295 [Thermodesulfobacteriota bacterium]|nr:hypothetical protein [Thermodesulfobacteriota bacterium]
MTAVRSNQNKSFFLDLKQRACRNGVQTVVLEDEQKRLVGIILFDASLDKEKIKKIATKIGGKQSLQKDSQICPMPEQDLHQRSRESCQVTVEERSQLFAFLNN